MDANIEYAILYLELNLFSLILIWIILHKTRGLSKMVTQRNFAMSIISEMVFFISDSSILDWREMLSVSFAGGRQPVSLPRKPSFPACFCDYYSNSGTYCQARIMKKQKISSGKKCYRLHLSCFLSSVML